MAWWSIIEVVGNALIEPGKRAIKKVLDVLHLASNMNTLVSQTRPRFFSAIDGKAMLRKQRWDDVERRLCEEALPEACKEIENGTPALEACAPAIIAAGCVIADGIGLKGPNGNSLTPNEVARVMCFGHPDASAWRMILVAFETLIPASFVHGRDALSFFQKTSRRRLVQLRTFADHQVPASPQNPEDSKAPPAVPPESKGDPFESLRKQVGIDRKTIESGGRLLLDEQERVATQLFAKVSANDRLFDRLHLIQGIAGSGKTVLLGALVPKIAASLASTSGYTPRLLIYHRNNYLRTPLRNDVSRNLNEFYKVNGGQRPSFNVLHIHDLYKHLFDNHGFTPAKRPVYEMEPFEIAKHLIAQREHESNPKAVFDLVFVDEGQDICEEEYVLLRQLVNGAPHFGMVVFYDDFQNLFSAGTKTVTERISNLGDIDSHALGVCVRSSKNILDFALNAALGPRCSEEDREKIENALGVGRLMESGGLIDVPNRAWPATLYSCELCVFKGGRISVIPAESNEELRAKVVETLRVFASGTGDQFKFPWSCLVLCLNNTLLDEVFHSATAGLGKDFDIVLRSNVPSMKKGEWLPK